MTRPLASLTSGLLARKGAARPAMRPQLHAATPAPIEDLGWNDMGTPAPEPEAPAGPIPPVLLEREALAKAIVAPEPAKPVSLPTAERLRRETAHAGKAALTLRLDADRHLKLRLASAISNRSGQDLLTQALDALVDAMPSVAALVEQLPPAKPTKAKTGPR